MMDDKIVILIGNGLGMSIDPDHFLLKRGLGEAFNQLKRCEKHVIFELLKKEPENEDDLLHLHHLKKTLDQKNEIKNPLRDVLLYEDRNTYNRFNLENIPEIVSKLRSKCAKTFLALEDLQALSSKWGNAWTRATEFLDRLGEFILNNGKKVNKRTSWKHICLSTLNYDNLITKYYQLHSCRRNEISCSKTNIVGGGTNAVLQDGFGSCFLRNNLYLKERDSMGYYLHLHGSAIFDQTGNGIEKLGVNRRGFTLDEISDRTEEHIILANREEKLDLIGDSPLLSEYWKIFENYIYHCRQLFIVGCGHNDIHIKDLILKRLQYFSYKPINIFIISCFFHKGDDADFKGWKEFLEQTTATTIDGLEANEDDVTPDTLNKDNARVLVRMNNLLDFHWFNN